MAKRFIETTIWSQNKWFRKLAPKYKALWFYIISMCDPVGVWEEDLEMAEFAIGDKLDVEETHVLFAKQIKSFSDNKWWVKDFCYFQYGVLKEENIANKPHQSYISLLKKHSLWEDYLKTIKSQSKEPPEKKKRATPAKPKISYTEKLAERKTEFRKKIFAFSYLYDETMLQDFYDYWSEEDRRGMQMKMEFQKTWNLAKRLKMWKRIEDEKRFKKSDNNENKEKKIIYG